MEDRAFNLMAGFIVFAMVAALAGIFIQDRIRDNRATKPDRAVTIESIEFKWTKGRGDYSVALDGDGTKYDISDKLAVKVVRGNRDCITRGTNDEIKSCE